MINLYPLPFVRYALACACALLLLLLQTHRSQGVLAKHGAFDETMWMHSAWQQCTPPFPFDNVKALLANADAVQSIEASTASSHTSLLGPYPLDAKDLLAYTGMNTHDASIASGERQDLDPTHVKQGAKAVRCDVCNALVGEAWNAAVDHLHLHFYQKRAQPDLVYRSMDVRLHLEQACEHRVPANVLRGLSIKQISVPLFSSIMATVWMFVTEARMANELVTDVEIAAAEQACQDVLQRHVDPHTGALHVLTSLRQSYVSQYEAAWEAHCAAEPLQHDIEIVESDQADCRDKHDMCPQWAARGECQKNPNYMVGTRNLKGHCLLSCGVCEPAGQVLFDPWQHMPEPVAEQLKSILEEQQSTLKSEMCQSVCGVRAQLNLKPLGTARFDNLLSGQDAAVSHEAGTSSMDSQDKQDGPLRKAERSRTPGDLAMRLWYAALPRERALLVPARQAGVEPNDVTPPPSSGVDEDVNNVLYNGLAGHCVLLNKGWWIYEYCYNSRIRQLHVEKGDVVQEILIGRFDGHSTVKQANGYSFAGADEVVVSQFYGGGSACNDKQRSAYVNYGCSDDGRLHMAVEEPEECAYAITLTSPAFCMAA